MNKILCYVFVFFIFLSSNAWANSECDSILRDGTMAKTDYSSNDYLRRILHWRYASQDIEKSKSDTSFGATIPIYGVLVDFDFSKDEAFEAQRSINQSLDIANIEHHTLDYMLISGDKVIAKAWSDCINSSSGFFTWFDTRERNSAVLNMEYVSKENNSSKFEIQDISLLSLKRGMEPTKMKVPNNKCLKTGTQLRSGDICKIIFQTASDSESLLLVVNGQINGGGFRKGSSAFLPSVMKWVRRTDSIDSRNTDPKVLASVSQNYWNSSVQTGSPACLSISKFKGATFIKATAKSEPDNLCDGDGGCWGQVKEVTDDSFCWVAGVHTHYNSCTCNAAGMIRIFRSKWVSLDELEPDPAITGGVRLRDAESN